MEFLRHNNFCSIATQRLNPRTKQLSKDVLQRWKESRSGAWAGRGFHYQHLFSVLILVRQWAGLAPTGFLVPEGLEDCVIELTNHELWIQIKSRKEGGFHDLEVQKFLKEVDSKASSSHSGKQIRTAIALEQSSEGKPGDSIDQIFDGKTQKVVSYNAPEIEILNLLATNLNTAQVIAEGIASDLYRLVAEASEANASLPFEKRRRISTTEVERRIFERLEAEDPSAIDSALTSRILESIDFFTPVKEPSFYQGVKVMPGHITSGLVQTRPNEINDVVFKLRKRRHVLISGPSGAGKSALMWLSAHALAGELRWFQITGKAIAADADAIIRFVRSCRPNEASPIGLVFDEVGSSNSNVWDILVRELRGLPFVYFLGSVRQEDVNLIANHSDTEFIVASLNEELAETVWEKLSAEKQTSWAHWREPFEQSEGLMLEYVHLLTQGKRLFAVIEEQVRQREAENREDELAIIRCTAVLCARGGEVEAGKLIELLRMKSSTANQALKRLIDEHLVRESRPGVLGGLHMLRSEALSKAAHDETVFLVKDSLWKGLSAATRETLPRIIQSILAEAQKNSEAGALQKLAGALGTSRDIEVWISILTGMGLATLERSVSLFIKILEEHGVQRAQWPLASMFVDPDIDIPELAQFEQWQRLRDAILAFRASTKNDLRPACLELLPEGSPAPPCGNLQQINEWLSCLTPICGGDPVRMALPAEFTGNGKHDIREVAAMLSTAYLVSQDTAESLVSALGGEQVLFSWFRSQIPWVTSPVIETDGTHGRTIRSNWFYVAEQYQPDPHETVCNICEILIAISPTSDAAACDAINPLGQLISVGGHTLWSKNMPRKNIHPKTRVAWNVAFRQILLAKSATYSLTDYTRQMGQLVQRTEKVFRTFTEKWINGKTISNSDALVAEINEIVNAVNSLAYATPEKMSPVMTKPPKGGGTHDTLGALLTGILGNLVGRMNKAVEATEKKAVATFAGSLTAQAQEHKRSDIWRTMSSPPLNELDALANRLNDAACILYEMVHHEDQTVIQRMVKVARKCTLGKAIRSVAQRCRSLADQRFHDRLRALENTLKKEGWNARCWSRPIDDSESVYWPPREVAILVDIKDFETDARFIEDGLRIGQQVFGNDWRFRIVPVINGQVVASLALLPSSHMSLVDQDFAREWKEYIDRPFHSSGLAQRFDEGIAACTLLSGIIACRNLDSLHPEENEAFSKAIETFERNRKIIVEAAENSDSEYLGWATNYLEENWKQVIGELEAAKVGQKIEVPLCMATHQALAGQENERAAELVGARVLLLQAECNDIAKSNAKQSWKD